MSVTERRITYLESKLPKKVDVEKKYRKNFNRAACHKGNGIYEWAGCYSTDTRELFLMGVLGCEGIKFKQS